ncbi:hypothetical protein G5B00_05150 [Parapedobacter sp. SGR-10]|uniref:DUF5683 domain-containing protein n=1 Tax=Parapedobacter sp. SGR-10 TaxID=2710879 RepID=UPI0013D3B350|nr:DUF5683 domain-containing protein [Parapedobacter sp. SGR-10]NGF55895.1 hypothetical protein [Parapedobacter sp. SGR-10]
MKVLFVFLFVFCAFLHVKAQEPDTIRQHADTSQAETDIRKGLNIQDTTGQDTLTNAQDTVKKETRKERREREKAEKEREKYYYKDIRKDSTRLAIEHLSRIAWKRSLIVPGWGQYTNGGAWWIKVPVIYGGFISAGIIFDYWQWYYRKFGDEAAHRINNNGMKEDPDLMGIDQLDYLIRQKDYGRRNRDLTILATIGWWGLNVVEAYTTSILKYRYDIGDDLTVKVVPTAVPVANSFGMTAAMNRSFVPGIRLTMNIK